MYITKTNIAGLANAFHRAYLLCWELAHTLLILIIIYILNKKILNKKAECTSSSAEQETT